MKRLLPVPLVFLLLNFGIAQQKIGTFSSITETCALGNRIFFTARIDAGDELYVSDGPAGDARLVKDINPGYPGSSPVQLTVMNDVLYFIAYSAKHGRSVWRSDGTSEGTEMIYALENSDPNGLFVFRNKLYFTTNFGTIIESDGTPGGGKIFFEASYKWGRISTVVLSEDKNYIYFTESGTTIYRDNGQVRESFSGPLSWEDVYFRKIFSVGNNLIAIKSSSYDAVIRIYSLRGDQIVDGGEAEWVLIKKLDAPGYGRQEIENFTVASGKLFFSFRTYYDNVPPTDELWVSDGTAGGTKAIKVFSWEPHWYQSEMIMFFEFGGKVWFRGGNPAGKALWTSDGTVEGTTKFHDVVITAPYNDEKLPVFVMEDKFYFSGDDNNGNAELWVSDGVTARQFLDVKDDGGSLPHLITAAGDVVYFVTGSQFSTVLWSSRAQPDISVKGMFGNVIESGTTPSLFYGAAVGTCKTEKLTVTNSGQKELYLRQIFITGRDYTLKQQVIPEVLKPNESIVLEITLNPVTSVTTTATLTILSSDEDESSYVVNFVVTPGSSVVTGICRLTESDVKMLSPGITASPVSLSNASIPEGQPAGTAVGTLSLVAGGPATFSFTSGEGDLDNGNFVLDANVLRSNKVFNHNERNLYSVRIKATTESGVLEASFRVNVLNASITQQMDCSARIGRMNFVYHAIEFNSLGHLFATTSNGRILRSLDQGLTWQVVYETNSYSSPREIFFKGNIGYVQTSNVLLKSDDNGASWFPVYIPFGGQYYVNYHGVHFLTEEEGYVVTEEGEVFYTKDGGRSWEQRSGTNWNEFRDVNFINREKGFGIAGFGDLLMTTDGGRTWSEVNLSSLGWNTRARDIWFLDEYEGFMCTEYKVYKTSDGGFTWFEVQGLFSGEAGKIKFYSDKLGYLYGGYSSYAMYRTTDGGNTWTRITPNAVPGPLNGVAESSGKIFVINQSSYSDDRARSLQASANLGASWSILDYFAIGTIYQLDFATDTDAVAIGEYGIFKTKDKGHTWKQSSMGVPNVGDVYFLNPSELIMLSGGHLYKSMDGGITAKNVLTTEQTDPYRPAGKVYGFGSGVLFSVSWYAVYRSDDQGETWTLVSTDPGYYTQGMHFISSTTGYRIELFGSVQKTTDGGKTWVNVFTREPHESDPFNAIFFVNESVGFSGGRYLRKTTDGGITWQKIEWPLTDIIAINFQTADHGYVVSRYGAVNETYDGGASWQTIYYAGSQAISDVQFRGANLYMAGQDGFLASSFPKIVPSIPGYINGPTTVCAGDAAQFIVSADNTAFTQWSTTAVNVSDSNGRLMVRFPDAGQYTVSARNINTCGVSDVRTTSINVTGDPAPPVIDGPESVQKGSQAVEYSVTNAEPGSQFVWLVQGGAQAGNTENRLVVNWSANAAEGRVTVLVVSAGGCRADGSRDIGFEVVLAAETDLQNEIDVYPNPAEAETTIYSSHNGSLLVRLIDTSGREYSRLELHGGEKRTVPTHQLPAGLYIIEITGSEGAVTRKLIKK